MKQLLEGLQSRLCDIDKRVAEFDKELERAAASDDRCKRIMTVPGVGSYHGDCDCISNW